MVNTVVSPAASGGERGRNKGSCQNCKASLMEFRCDPHGSEIRFVVRRRRVFPLPSPHWKPLDNTVNRPEHRLNQRVSVTPLRHKDEAHRRSRVLRSDAGSGVASGVQLTPCQATGSCSDSSECLTSAGQNDELTPARQVSDSKSDLMMFAYNTGPLIIHSSPRLPPSSSRHV